MHRNHPHDFLKSLITSPHFYRSLSPGVSLRLPRLSESLSKNQRVELFCDYRYHMEGVGEPDKETWRKIFGVPDTMARLAVARFGEGQALLDMRSD